MADSYRTKIARVVSRLRCLDPEYRDIDLGSFFRDNSGQEDHDELYRALLGSFHVRSLTIGGRERYNNVEYLKLLDSLPCLEKLTIADQCSNEVLHTIKASIYKSKSIRTVCLKQTSSLEPFLSNVLMAMTTLRVLELDDVSKRSNYRPFHDKRAKRSVAEAYAANKSLRSLHFGSVGGFSRDLSRCAESMVIKEISSPRLCEVSIGGSVCSVIIIKLLRKLLQSTSCLAKLSVNLYKDTYYTERGSGVVERIQPWMEVLLDGLETNQSVTHLGLQNAGVFDLDLLGRFLVSDLHLIELDMGGCLDMVDPCSLRNFFAGIGCNSHLRSLSIVLSVMSISLPSNGTVSDEVPLQLIHALKTNETLETVTVGLDLSDVAMRAIAEAVPSFNMTDFSLLIERGGGDLAIFTSKLDQDMGLTALRMCHSSLRRRSLRVGDFLGGNRTLCRLTIECVDADNLADIFCAVELNTTLEYLEVSLAYTLDFGRQASLRLLCASLPRFRGLKELVMDSTSFEWVTLKQAERRAFCDNGSLQKVVNDFYYWCREEEDRSFLDFCALRNQRAAFVEGRGGRALWSRILTKLSEKPSKAQLSVLWNCLRSRLDWVKDGL